MMAQMLPQAGELTSVSKKSINQTSVKAPEKCYATGTASTQ